MTSATMTSGGYPYPEPFPSPAVPPARNNRAWDFYHSLGSPRYICAPMVDQSELAFRMLVRKYKVDLCYTPMVHSRIYRHGGADVRRRQYTTAKVREKNKIILVK